jgi:hypothetical protein
MRTPHAFPPARHGEPSPIRKSNRAKSQNPGSAEIVPWTPAGSGIAPPELPPELPYTSQQAMLTPPDVPSWNNPSPSKENAMIVLSTSTSQSSVKYIPPPCLGAALYATVQPTRFSAASSAKTPPPVSTAVFRAITQ